MHKTTSFPALTSLFVLAAVAFLPSAARAENAPAACPTDAYNIVWDSPSKDCGGSMPLGNGDVGANVWADANGDIFILISKTDAWDDSARLVKVGLVRVHLAWPDSPAEGAASTKDAAAKPASPFAGPFRQTLSLGDATIKIDAGLAGRRVAARVWVEANSPVVHLTADSDSPLEATACVELWRTKQFEYSPLQCSDIMTGAPADRKQPTIIEPDTLLPAGPAARVGWYHHNVKSFGPAILADVQDLKAFPQEDPLLHRTFGAVVTAVAGQRLDDLRLRCPPAKSQRLNIFVLTCHPSTPEKWLTEMDRTIAAVEAVDFAARRADHERWWREFWDRSWIRATLRPGAQSAGDSPVPANTLPLRIGSDQAGGNKWAGEIGRVSIFARALNDPAVQALAKLDRKTAPPAQADLLYTGSAMGPIADSAKWDFPRGLTVEAWVRPDKLSASGARIADKITPGGSNGFLFDTHPGNSLRFICGQTQTSLRDALPPGKWTHVAAVADPGGACRLYVDGNAATAGAASESFTDEAAFVSQMYHVQRFIAACAGRGRYPIKFNGSIFTVAPRDGKSDQDFRRWGPGYWWQNTRLPYFPMPAAGDYDMMKPLFRMYVGDLLELNKFRTRLYCGHDGAYYPECIYFWGPMFSETYGWQPATQRTDKLQASRWHKREWVGALELCWLMLDYYEHTQDSEFLRQTLLPASREILTFFDQHYKVNDQGKMVMHPGQALETWWDCTNPMPELAGILAVTRRLQALPQSAAPADQREFWRRLQAKCPPLPIRQLPDGNTALAPAEKYEIKHNIENPELYAVYPFGLAGVGRPNLQAGIAALHNRWDRGDNGWRQDSMFMACLGLTDEARKSLVARARHHDATSRFPAFWGPNYDWVPDQDHGSNLLTTMQLMLLQTDGRRIRLLPAWPSDWNADFKLHAPYQTTLEGKVRDGKLTDLTVTPKERQKDVTVGTGP